MENKGQQVHARQVNDSTHTFFVILHIPFVSVSFTLDAVHETNYSD
jgi:hypothetical protein